MICPKCNNRMKCVETSNINNRVARRYKCMQCNELYYSMEKLVYEDECDKARSIITEKRYKYY
jgi:transcriptional regulator NrdR family protein